MNDKNKWAKLQPLMSAVTWLITTMQGVTNLMAAKRRKDDDDLQEAKDSIKRLQKRLRMASAALCRQSKAFEQQSQGEAVGYRQLLPINQALDCLVKAAAELASSNADDARSHACQGLKLLEPFVDCDGP